MVTDAAEPFDDAQDKPNEPIQGGIEEDINFFLGDGWYTEANPWYGIFTKGQLGRLRFIKWLVDTGRFIR